MRIERDDITPEAYQAIAEMVLEHLRPLLSGSGRSAGEDQSIKDDRHLNVKQLSEYLGMSSQWIYNNMNTLPHFNLNRKPLFRKSEIDAWLEQYRVKNDEVPVTVLPGIKPIQFNQESAGNIKVRSFKQRKALC